MMECFQKRTVHITQTRAVTDHLKVEQDTYVHIANGNTTHFGDLSRGRRVGIREREALGVEVGRVEVEESLKISRHTQLWAGWVCVPFACPFWVSRTLN